MKTFVLLVSIFFITYVNPVWAWDSGSADKTILSELLEYTQPKPTGTSITEWNMSAVYIRDVKTLTDRIIIKIGNRTRVIKGPWSLASFSKRRQALNAWPDYTSTGFYDYSILRLSPSGNYIELVGTSMEGSIWRMLDTRTGKIVFSDNIVTKSMWSSDRKRFAFQVCKPTEIMNAESCLADPDTQKTTYITVEDAFPTYKVIQ